MLQILPNHTLGQAIQEFQEYIRNNNAAQYMEPLRKINADYQLILHYMEKGIKDEKRDLLYNNLLRKLDMLMAECQLEEWQKTRSAYVTGAAFLKQQQPIYLENVLATLQNFASDIALAHEGLATQSMEQIYGQYTQYTDTLFHQIWLAGQWKQETADTFRQIILSPTIHTNDAQLLVTAITLALLNIFDVNKFKLLIDIYKKTNDLQVKQKALVGWALSIHPKTHVYPEIKAAIDELIASKKTREELLQTQIQIYLCMNAEKDHEEIQREIMPSIIHNNNLNITPFGITEKEDDPMQDILDPEAEDRAMQEMEQSVQKMIDMQKQGADIYFGGFVHMKNFHFFQQITNWFRAFDINHPELNSIRQKIKTKQNTQTTILNILQQKTLLCDSDKYSFTLAMTNIIDQMPQNIMEAIGSSEALVQPEEAQQQTSLVARRLYLQSLYRFFKAYRHKKDFYNPFQQLDKQHTLFAHTLTEDGEDTEEIVTQLAKFLYKQKQYNDLQTLLQNNPQCRNQQLQNLRAYLLIKQQKFQQAIHTLTTTDTLPSTQQLALLAKAYMLAEQYQKAEETYWQLITDAQENTSQATLLRWQINHAQTLIRQKKTEQALKQLYQYNYNYPEDHRITRLLAYTLLCEQKAEQALKQYEKIAHAKQTIDQDYLNAAYAYWVTQDIPQAIMSFRKYLRTVSATTEGRELLRQAFASDQQLLDIYQITPVQCNIIIDLICQQQTDNGETGM